MGDNGELLQYFNEQKSGLNVRRVHVGFVVDEVALGQDFSSSRSILPFSCQFHSSSIQQSLVILLFMLYILNNWHQGNCLVSFPDRDDPRNFSLLVINPLALELDIYSLAHHLCKMRIFYEPRRVTLGNTRHFVEE